jgi:hypothetical protein
LDIYDHDTLMNDFIARCVINYSDAHTGDEEYIEQ